MIIFIITKITLNDPILVRLQFEYSILLRMYIEDSRVVVLFRTILENEMHSLGECGIK